MRGGLTLAALVAAQTVAACSQPCCTYDSQPIALEKGKHGELLARVSVDGAGNVGSALLDTGSPISLWNRPGDGAPEVQRHEVRILGTAMTGTRLPTRAILRQTATVDAPLAAIDGTDASVEPLLLLGGDLFVNFSIEIGFAAPQLVIWPEERATDGFLSGAGYAVLHAKLRGAGQLEALAPRDGIGPRGPYQYPSSLLVLRACGAPSAFDRQAPLPARCCAGDERTLASGTDLSLLLATGVGPLVLARSAWTRVTAQLPAPPAEVAGELRVATASMPIPAAWSALPRLALVDRQADPSIDPGPCVELGRARRLEQVDLAQTKSTDHAACALPCDQDPTRGRAADSAAYLELSGALPVAIVADGEQILQTARAEVRPDGPEIDGILGAGALADVRVELDYRSPSARAIFSCEAGAAATDCRTVGSCPRLPKLGQTHTCFGLPTHALPQICDNQIACE